MIKLNLRARWQTSAWDNILGIQHLWDEGITGAQREPQIQMIKLNLRARWQIGACRNLTHYIHYYTDVHIFKGTIPAFFLPPATMDLPYILKEKMQKKENKSVVTCIIVIEGYIHLSYCRYREQVTIWSLSYFRTCFASPSTPLVSYRNTARMTIPPFPYSWYFYPLSKR
jgi:hypothetical protein